MKANSKRVTQSLLLMVLMTLLIGITNISEARRINAVADDLTVEILITQNSRAKFYKFMPYQSIYISKEFLELRNDLLITGKLVGTQTVIIIENGKVPVVAHRVIALRARIKDCKPYDKLEIRTNSYEIAEENQEKYVTEAGFELKGFGKKDNNYILVFER